MNEFDEQVVKIAGNRKKFRKFDCVEVPVSFSVLKNDGSVKGSILWIDKEAVYTSIPSYNKIKFQELLKNWLLESPYNVGQLMIPGMPDDSGIIMPDVQDKLQFTL